MRPGHRRVIDGEGRDVEECAGTLCLAADARASVDSLIAELKVRYIDGSNIARPLLALGDRDGALTWLERMVDDHATTSCCIAYDLEWKPLRADPRFVALVREVHSPKK